MSESADKNGKEQSWPEIVGVPTKLMDFWSSRKNDIDKLLEGQGLDPKTSIAQAKQAANLHSRKSKARLPSEEDFFKRCREEGERHGFGQHEAHKLVGSGKPAPTKDYEKVRDQVLARITKHQSAFLERDLIRGICEAMQDQGTDGIAIAKRVREDLAVNSEIVHLRPNFNAEPRFTTREMWQLEEKLDNHVRELRNRKGAVVPDQTVAKVLRPGYEKLSKLKRRKTLTPEETEAARELLTDTRQIRTHSYVAGSASTNFFEIVREGFERAGLRVHGAAVTAEAKQEFDRKTGIKSRTAASYLYHLDKGKVRAIRDRLLHDATQLLRALRGKRTNKYAPVKLTRRDVIILDSAMMFDTRTTERFLDLALKSGATIILAGDEKHPASALAGSPFMRIAEAVGSSSITGNLRQQNEEDREAVHDIRRGKALNALKSYAQRERLIVGKDLRDTVQALVKTWSQQGGARDPKNHVIYTQTRADAREVNALCQSERRERGQLRSQLPIRLGELRIYKGDRVLFHRAYRSGGIENGSQAVVIGINPLLRQITVFLDDEPSAEAKARGLSRIVTVPLKRLGKDGLSLAYAQRAMGQTVPNGYVLVGGQMTTQEMLYVQATRASERTWLFVDEQHAGEKLKDLARAVSRPSAKRTAHDIGREHELHIEPNPSPKEGNT